MEAIKLNISQPSELMILNRNLTYTQSGLGWHQLGLGRFAGRVVVLVFTEPVCLGLSSLCPPLNPDNKKVKITAAGLPPLT